MNCYIIRGFFRFDDLSLSKMYIKQVIRHLYLNRQRAPIEHRSKQRTKKAVLFL